MKDELREDPTKYVLLLDYINNYLYETVKELNIPFPQAVLAKTETILFSDSLQY
jgi:hypothetical protein